MLQYHFNWKTLPAMAGVAWWNWSHWKHHELPNFCPQTFWQLSNPAPVALRRIRRRTTLVTGFWVQSQLF